MCLFSIHICSLLKYLFKFFVHAFKNWAVFLLFSLESSLNILEKVLYHICYLHICHPIYGLPFHLLRVGLKEHKLLILMRTILLKNTILLVSYIRNLGPPSKVSMNFSHVFF